MREVLHRLTQTFFTALIITSAGIAMMVTFSSLYNSRTSLDGMINQQVIEKTLKRQNENYYNELYKRYDRLSRNIDDYQTQTNSRFDYVEKRLDKIDDRLNNENNSINIDNSSTSSVQQ